MKIVPNNHFHKLRFESMESLLIAALRQDSGDHVFKYLAPRNLARLEQCLTSKLVFVPAGEGDALLHMVAARRHVEAAKKGATMLVPLGEGREGRIAWATELRWIHLAMVRLRVGGRRRWSARDTSTPW